MDRCHVCSASAADVILQKSTKHNNRNHIKRRNVFVTTHNYIAGNSEERGKNLNKNLNCMRAFDLIDSK